MKMKELPIMERPYEKLENNGASSLSTAELLAIIIKNGTKNKTALEIAQELLKEDTKENGIRFINQLSLQELMKKEGIGRVKAIALKAVAELTNRSTNPSKKKDIILSCPREAYELVRASYLSENQEIIKTILLTCHKKVIKVVDSAKGAANVNIITAKEIYGEAIKSCADSIIIMHNHPSGDSRPSNPDIEFTKKMKAAGTLMGIVLLDHIIVAEEEFYSMRESKMI